ncbi:HD domain-containing phosphohydrolase [Desulfovibrio gilichinskyi]|uniref:Putative two-component system response regulator n=1 Tax=Desulfovibrio gilichinskyi TaxID=1519643 RepID=A0A1X7EWQ8_9BACT|nr:HD domain-containing phosphohydrolase [Desulfovibrio gilichinskyi]SMF41727.1 putative two-component system response regulator [Desulfovibrio gilichinskyi]
MKKAKILLVDDEERNIRLLEAMLLPEDYILFTAKDGEDALTMAHEHSPDLVLLDIMMPKIDGFEVARQLKKDEATKDILIVMVTALKDVESRVKALEAGGDEFLSKPIDKSELVARVRSLLKVKAYNDYMRDSKAMLVKEVAKKNIELQWALGKLKGASLDTINRLSRIAEYKDKDTAGHILRMSLYSVATARQLGLHVHTQESILYAAPMHDIGKVGIPDNVLLKSGPLTPEEWIIMKQHPAIGSNVFHGAEHGFLKLASIIALTHHEKWDGSGYPNGLQGKTIPLVGRITAIADVFDALTTRRPYKEPFSLEESFVIIEKGRGTHFDPQVIDAFFAAQDEVLSIFRAHSNGHDEVKVYSILSPGVGNE